MIPKLKQFRWDRFVINNQTKHLSGLMSKHIQFYDSQLIEQLRTVDLFGIPASVLLLSRNYCNSRCHECAYLLAKSFFATDDEIRVYDAMVNSLKLNPKYTNPGTHSFVERVMPNGEKLIYDTTAGLIYDRKTYWQIERPRIVNVTEKSELMQYGAAYEKLLLQKQPDLPQIAMNYVQASLDDDDEIYCCPSNHQLQQELALFNAQKLGLTPTF